MPPTFRSDLLRTMLGTLIIVLLLTFGIPERNIDPELDPYVKSYISLIESQCPGKFKYNHQFNVTFGKLTYPTIGLCFSPFDTRSITIDPDNWQNESDSGKLALMYHELSHCILNKKHVDLSTNYMYHTTVDLTSMEVVNQTVGDIKDWCSH